MLKTGFLNSVVATTKESLTLAECRQNTAWMTFLNSEYSQGDMSLVGPRPERE